MEATSIKEIRHLWGVKIAKKLLPRKFCVVSDDCWGGQVYRQHGLPYNTPTVGLYVHPMDYINFFTNLHKSDACDMTFIQVEGSHFPIAQTPYAKLFFVHYNSEQAAKDAFLRRYKRIDWDNLFIKIDFGKKEYTQEHIDQWNKLKISRSLALYPLGKTEAPIWNSVRIRRWLLDGAEQFDNTRRYVNIFKNLQDGTIECKFDYRLLNFLILDPAAWRWLRKTFIAS
ncbi:DUF1919 domain-containing protein [Spirosoma flavum]|uniref:DUF1919 domain-containing protein n=1 Tax=Spirosoma flavum TaxID=2048557 RepID=A0ABW6ARB0_9BACT